MKAAVTLAFAIIDQVVSVNRLLASTNGITERTITTEFQ